VLLSNRILAIVALVLLAGAIGDGVLYNRPDVSPAIYPLDNVRSIKISHQEHTLLALQKTDGQRWEITAPFHAPAKSTRVALLLDTNVQTARSYTLRTKENDGLTHAFTQPITLRLDEHEFLLGDIETVSQLRYVLANDHVYLQADHIVPLLQSPKSTFTDLRITDAIKGADIRTKTGETSLNDTQLAAWDKLDALAVIDAAMIDAETPDRTEDASVVLQLAANKRNTLHVVPFREYVALQPKDKNFAYLISEEQALALGVCVYCR
jgi:hypothetical protein